MELENDKPINYLESSETGNRELKKRPVATITNSCEVDYQNRRACSRLICFRFRERAIQSQPRIGQ